MVTLTSHLLPVLALVVLAACGGASPPGEVVPEGGEGAEDNPTAPSGDPSWTGPAVLGAVVIEVPSPSVDWAPVLKTVVSRHAGLTPVARDNGPAAASPADLVIFWPDSSPSLAGGPWMELPASLSERTASFFVAPDRITVAVVARLLAARRTLGTRPLGLLDLAEPRWAGKIQVADPSEPGFRRSLGALLTTRGPGTARRFLVDLSHVVNIRPPVPTESEIAQALSRGETQVSVLDHTSARAFTQGSAEESAVELIAPDASQGGVAWRPLVVAIPADAPHKDAALALIDSLLTPSGQRSIVSVTGLYPVLGDVGPPSGLPAVAVGQWSPTPLVDELSRSQSVDRLLTQVGLGPSADDGGPLGDGGPSEPTPAPSGATAPH